MALSQTFAEIAEEISTQSWVLMDEDQRDALMRNVIVPRWGETTADGVVLKATAWARMLGATADSIDGRYRRLCRSEAPGAPSGPGPSEHQEKHVSSARAAIRRHPALRGRAAHHDQKAKTPALRPERWTSNTDPREGNDMTENATTEAEATDLQPVKILVLQRGWVAIGRYAKDGAEHVLTDASVIRKWGTAKGLGQIAQSGPTSSTLLDATGTVRAHELSTVLVIDADAAVWADRL